MALETPGCPAANALPPLASRFLKVADLPWKPTQVEGIEMKVLLEDRDTGHFQCGLRTSFPANALK